MKKLGGSLLVAFLSFCSLGTSSAFAVSCYPTGAAMEAVKTYGLKPLILKGQYAQQFKPASLGIRTVDFAALLFDKDNNAFFFFGNVSTTCGPYQLNHKQVERFLRPA